MIVGVKEVQPIKDYRLMLTFANDEQKIFDMNPYLSTGIFSELRDETIFKSVHVSFDTIEWSNGADLCPELLYADSVSVKI